MTPDEDIAVRTETNARYQRARAAWNGFNQRRAKAIERESKLRARIAKDVAEAKELAASIPASEGDSRKALQELHAAEDAYRTAHSLTTRTRRNQ